MSGLSTRLLARSARKSAICAGMPSVRLVNVRVTCRWFNSADWAWSMSGLSSRPTCVELDFQRLGLAARVLLQLQHALQLAEDQRLSLGQSLFQLVPA